MRGSAVDRFTGFACPKPSSIVAICVFNRCVPMCRADCLTGGVLRSVVCQSVIVQRRKLGGCVALGAVFTSGKD